MRRKEDAMRISHAVHGPLSKRFEIDAQMGGTLKQWLKSQYAAGKSHRQVAEALSGIVGRPLKPCTVRKWAVRYYEEDEGTGEA